MFLKVYQLTRGVQNEVDRYGGTHTSRYETEPKMEVHQNGLTSREYPTNDQMRNTGYYGQSRGGVNNNQDTNQDNGYQNLR